MNSNGGDYVWRFRFRQNSEDIKGMVPGCETREKQQQS